MPSIDIVSRLLMKLLCFPFSYTFSITNYQYKCVSPIIISLTGYTNAHGKFIPHTQEHYFLTDPGQMIFTHLPYDTQEQHYDR